MPRGLVRELRMERGEARHPPAPSPTTLPWFDPKCAHHALSSNAQASPGVRSNTQALATILLRDSCPQLVAPKRPPV
jgi:hypothetical protein